MVELLTELAVRHSYMHLGSQTQKKITAYVFYDLPKH